MKDKMQSQRDGYAAQNKGTEKIRVVQSLILIFCVTGASAQNSTNPPDMASAIRANYDQSSELPDSIAFISTARLLKAMTEGESDEDAAGLQISMITTESKFDDVKAKKLIRLMLSSLEEFDAAHQAAGKNIACEYGVPRAVSYDAMQLFNSIDDEHDRLAEEHLSAFRKNFDADTNSKFQKWLEYRKLHIVHVTYDHKSLAQALGSDNLDGQIAGLCAALEAAGKENSR